MIHVITISELPELVIEQVCRHLFLAYGVGAEHSRHEPRESRSGAIDAFDLLRSASPYSTFEDDKTLLLTDEALVLPEGPLGAPPSAGFAEPERGLAVVSTHGLSLPDASEGEEDPEAWMRFAERVARIAIQQIGFLLGLHRCVDTRCAMVAPWLADASPTLCDFCRERSEERVRRARS